jgi:hypothetical protein
VAKATINTRRITIATTSKEPNLLGHRIIVKRHIFFHRDTPFCSLDETTETGKIFVLAKHDFITVMTGSSEETPWINNAIFFGPKHTAANVCSINPLTAAGRKKLQGWSSHSIRVGACVILCACGLTPIHIQFMLRWKSMAFMVYLQNLTFLCAQQNISINKVADMPNFV